MADAPPTPHTESRRHKQRQRKAAHMTADLMKRKFRNFPEAELRRRIAAARLA
jgi:hypothetical protein